MDREPISFMEGVMFTGSNCGNEGVGHDLENAIIAYDFKGQIARICARPWCLQVIDTIAVDDLTREEFDELTELIQGVSEYEDE